MSDPLAPHPYRGMRAVLATKHDKFDLVAPPLAAVVGLLVAAVEVDTDTLGTFSGEVPRPGTPWDTAVAKARLGIAASGVSIGLASEGSIGPSPVLPLLTADTELVVLVDDGLGIVVGETAVSHDIVAVSTDVELSDPLDDLDALLERAGLPEHGVIVRALDVASAPVAKGLHDRDEVLAAIDRIAPLAGGRVRVESDLRAHHCPSRRPVIAEAAHRLAVRLSRCCPGCAAPGWGMVRQIAGAPCVECGTPTRLVRTEVDGCVRCDTTEIREAVGAAGVDPASCPRCNP